ncbi:ABC transporter substrate-binding protein [Candidatus Woesearchaeota archaeon]|nr:ABC transporter substrate-binding protein [Candidatus Woesearchaeota archaeon]MBT4716899.1 ABC transporter substrate-binding protein [Candidatus Woesearchaeota archaeon]MBT7106662.1 ABC transporter substrate-binding protein [Candidatus Woesearchaeota archaeon]
MVRVKLAMILIVVVLIMGCGSSSITGKSVYEDIEIGFSLPLTGPVALYGEWALQGAQMAVDDINRAGGINNRLVRLIVEDDKCSPTEGTKTVSKLLDVDGLDKIIVYCGAVTPAVAPITEGKALTYSISVRTDPLIGKHPHLFNMPPAISNEMDKLAEHVIDNGVTKVAIFHQHDFFGQSYREHFQRAFEQNGGEITIIESVDKFESADLRTALLKAKEHRTEAIFTSFNPPHFANLLKQAGEYDVDVKFIGPWLSQTKLLVNTVGKSAYGVTYTYPFRVDESDFAVRYEVKYGEEPEMNAAFAYDAIMLMAGIGSNCDSVDCMVSESRNVFDYNGASGVFSFTEEQVAEREVFVKQITENGFVVVE